MSKFQFTLYSENYKPVSCVIEAKNRMDFNAHNKDKYIKAIQKICTKRHWNKSDLEKYGYNKYKIRKLEEEVE